MTRVTVHFPSLQYYSDIQKRSSPGSSMHENSANTNTRVRAAIAELFVFMSIAVVFFSSDLSTSVLSQARKRAAATQPVRPKKYSAFPHDAKAHQIECASCHKFPSENWNKVRTGDAAFPDITEYPRHESCLGCHKQQFFRGRPPTVCSICHLNPGPRDSSRHPFPNPREIFDLSKKGKTAESDFAVLFPHDKHIEIVAANGGPRSTFRNVSFDSKLAGEESCAVCHATLQPQGDSSGEYITKPPADLGEGFWLKKGTFKTKPIGHTTCFTCHSVDSGIGPLPTDCGTCHKLRQPLPPADFDATIAAKIGVSDRVTLDSWRRRDSTGKFQHGFVAHTELSCDTCHNVLTMNTTDAATKRVKITSCAMCHVTATADDGGALNYEAGMRKTNPAFQCTKCHLVFGKMPMPASHTAALDAAK